LTRELILLGTGTSVGVPVIGCRCPVCTSNNPKNNRTRTGVLVHAPDGDFLIDTSPELRIQLLDDLRIFGYRLDREIPLYCEEKVELHLRQAFNYAFEPLDPDAHHFAVPKLKFQRITTEPFELLGQMIRPIRLLHGKLPILGFRLNDVAYCTDVSAIPDESWPLLEGLDTLVIDALRDQPHPTHFSVGQALDVIDRVRPRRAYFTHVSHTLDYEATNARLPQNVELSFDGQRLSF
jgi:phosphoribosyl 1,2-cyclic phosphate phosphodiesterase